MVVVRAVSKWDEVRTLMAEYAVGDDTETVRLPSCHSQGRQSLRLGMLLCRFWHDWSRVGTPILISPVLCLHYCLTIMLVSATETYGDF